MRSSIAGHLGPCRALRTGQQWRRRFRRRAALAEHGWPVRLALLGERRAQGRCARNGDALERRDRAAVDRRACRGRIWRSTRCSARASRARWKVMQRDGGRAQRFGRSVVAVDVPSGLSWRSLAAARRADALCRCRSDGDVLPQEARASFDAGTVSSAARSSSPISASRRRRSKPSPAKFSRMRPGCGSTYPWPIRSATNMPWTCAGRQRAGACDGRGATCARARRLRVGAGLVSVASPLDAVAVNASL